MLDLPAGIPPELAKPFQLQGKDLLFFGLTVTLCFRTNFQNLNANLIACVQEFLELSPKPKIGGFPFTNREKRFNEATSIFDLMSFSAKIKGGRSWDGLANYPWSAAHS